MTRKEAIKILKKWRKNAGEVTDKKIGYIEDWWHKEDADALDLAISSLETDEAYQLEYKKPTTKNDLGDDLISRADALDCVKWGYGFNDVYKRISDLPSVTPQERKGHWISTETKGVRYAFWCRYKCSLCGELSDHTNFCPNCGAKMESEE